VFVHRFGRQRLGRRGAGDDVTTVDAIDSPPP
jgi:hypothetical protein